MQNYTIEELADKHQLSTRSVNICIAVQLFDLSSILNFFSNYRSFKILRNCGDHTNLELTKICHLYLKELKGTGNTQVSGQNADLTELNNNFDDFKKYRTS